MEASPVRTEHLQVILTYILKLLIAPQCELSILFTYAFFNCLVNKLVKNSGYE